MNVPSKRIAYFTPGKELKVLINRDPAQPVQPPLTEQPVSTRSSAVRGAWAADGSR